LTSLPHSIEAEKAVLGAILLDASFDGDANGTIYDAGHLSPEDFFDPKHRRIFGAMLRVNQKGAAPDGVAVADELDLTKELAAAGGQDYLADLLAGIGTAANIGHHAKIVAEKSQLRALSNVAQSVSAMIADATRPAPEVMEAAQRAIYAVSERAETGASTPVGTVVGDVFSAAERAYKDPASAAGLKTGFARLDDMTGGLFPGELTIIAARPSMGKTALALNIAEHVGRKKGVLVHSLEMAKEQLVLRMMCGWAGVSMRDVRCGRLRTEDWKPLTDACEKIRRLSVTVDDSASLSIMNLIGRARRAKYRDNIDLIVVDYMQLMSGDGVSENRQQEISSISRGLKILAKDLHVPVIALSQLSRKCEERADARPLLSDLRESGSIEQDADTVIAIYRDEVYHPDDASVQGAAELLIRKSRNGPTGQIELRYDGPRMRFSDLETDAEGREVVYGY
jgi:replicative DNA helicase